MYKALGLMGQVNKMFLLFESMELMKIIIQQINVLIIMAIVKFTKILIAMVGLILQQLVVTSQPVLEDSLFGLIPMEI